MNLRRLWKTKTIGWMMAGRKEMRNVEDLGPDFSVMI